MACGSQDVGACMKVEAYMGEGCGWEAGGCTNMGVQVSMGVCTNVDTMGGVAEKRGMNEGVCTQADGG
jgi:hypothetical protein